MSCILIVRQQRRGFRFSDAPTCLSPLWARGRDPNVLERLPWTSTDQLYRKGWKLSEKISNGFMVDAPHGRELSDPSQHQRPSMEGCTIMVEL